MRAFSFQWAQRTWTDRVGVYTGRPIPYCASNQFGDAGIVCGDTLYVLALADRREDILLIGRFEVASRQDVLEAGDPVDACLTRAEAVSVLGEAPYGVPLFDANCYLIPRPGTATPMRFDRGTEGAVEFRFGAPGEETKSLFRDPDGRANQQAVRSVRQLRASTVSELDQVLSR